MRFSRASEYLQRHRPIVITSYSIHYTKLYDLLVVQERIPEVDERFRSVNPLHFLEWRDSAGYLSGELSLLNLETLAAMWRNNFV